MRRILFSLLMVFAAVAVVTGATRAWLSDTETAADNTFASGTIDLKTNDADGVTQGYKLEGLKPGDWNNSGQIVLKNAGTVKGHAWYEITNVRNYENACLEQETGDTTCDTTVGQGELGSLVKASLQVNISPWTRYPSSGLTSINAASGVRYDLEDLDPGETLPLVNYAVWTAGNTDNLAQGDSVVFDIVFHLDQVH